jgi:hypothetical protein
MGSTRSTHISDRSTHILVIEVYVSRIIKIIQYITSWEVQEVGPRSTSCDYEKYKSSFIGSSKRLLRSTHVNTEKYN